MSDIKFGIGCTDLSSRSKQLRNHAWCYFSKKKQKRLVVKGGELIQKGSCGTHKNTKAQRKQLLGNLFFA